MDDLRTDHSRRSPGIFPGPPRKWLWLFPGGTDSAYLLYAARACGCHVRAYYAASPFQPAFELEDAKKLAVSLKAEMTILPLNVLELSAVRENPSDRCYHCKNAIFSRILEAAEKDGFLEIMDGTNASDDAGDRPGMRALRELRVLSPLRICSVTKRPCGNIPGTRDSLPGTSRPMPALPPESPLAAPSTRRS